MAMKQAKNKPNHQQYEWEMRNDKLIRRVTSSLENMCNKSLHEIWFVADEIVCCFTQYFIHSMQSKRQSINSNQCDLVFSTSSSKKAFTTANTKDNFSILLQISAWTHFWAERKFLWKKTWFCFVLGKRNNFQLTMKVIKL